MSRSEIPGGDATAAKRAFVQALLEDIDALEVMISRGLFESGARRIGAEQEIFLVDEEQGPARCALEVIESVGDERLTTELGLFNLELNLSPRPFRGSCLSELESELIELLDATRAGAQRVGAEVVLTGILPTLCQRDLSEESMTPKPRYRRLSQAMRDLRGGEFVAHIEGLDELHARHDNVMLEASNTSFQIHFQVAPAEFAHLYNVAQLVTAPVLAAAVNSPTFLGQRLWHETRVALMQQSIDVRSETHVQRGGLSRVSFGDRWIDDSVLEIFREDIARFRVLLSEETGEGSLAILERGEVPPLRALCFHNGSVYRWNRPCYGITDGRPHLRIENRVLPAGPTVGDELANAAFFYGLMCFFSGEPDIPGRMAFDAAQSNFFTAARYGLHARLQWLDGRTLGVDTLILDELLPAAKRGLGEHGIDPTDIDRHLGVIERRVRSGRTGSQWAFDSLEAMGQQGSPDERLRLLTDALVKHSGSGRPVHDWELARFRNSPRRVRGSYRTVAQVMTTDLFTVGPDDRVDLAASVMDWKHVRHVPVESEDGALVGLVTHRQLLRLVGRALRGDLEPPIVRQIMVPQPVTVSPETPVQEAIARMREHQVACLPVVDGVKIVGIVTERDFIDVASRLLDRWLNAEP